MRLLCLLCLFITLPSFGQDVSHLIKLGVSANSYKGDLNKSYEKWAASFHMGFMLNKAKRLNSEFELSIGKVQGQNPQYVYEGDPSATPNQFFNTRFLNFNYLLHINIISKDFFKLYISPGIGIFRFTPQDQFYENLEDQVSTRPFNESYSSTSLVFPIRLGAFYLLKNGYGLGMQVGYMNLTTDYADNISEWGNDEGNDNILQWKISFLAPLKFFEKEKKVQESAPPRFK